LIWRDCLGHVFAFATFFAGLLLTDVLALRLLPAWTLPAWRLAPWLLLAALALALLSALLLLATLLRLARAALFFLVTPWLPLRALLPAALVAHATLLTILVHDLSPFLWTALKLVRVRGSRVVAIRELLLFRLRPEAV